MNRLCLVATLLLLAACPKKSSTPPPDNAGDNAGDLAAGGGAAGGTEPAAVVLVALQAGDQSCNVVVRELSGEEVVHAGVFEVCAGGERDATALIGQQVRITLETVEMAADSCEGDPECPDHQDVAAVTAITAVE